MAAAMVDHRPQDHYNPLKNGKRNLDSEEADTPEFSKKRQRKVLCTNEMPHSHTDSSGSVKINYRRSCKIYRCDVPLESYPGLSYRLDYGCKLFEIWKEVIDSGHLYKFLKNGKERFREISEDETIPEEFITFYVIDMSGTFDKTCLLGRNKDIDVTTEVIDLSKHESGLKIKANALIIKQDTQKLAIKEMEKHTELTESFVRDMQQSGDSAFSTVEQGTEFEAKVEKIFVRKMVKLMQTTTEFIKPIIPNDVGDVDFHLIHDKDKLFRTITAELFVPVPGTLRNGKIRAMRHERRQGRKQRSSKQIPLCQHKLEQKSTLAKVEIKVRKYLINGLMKRFQLPYAVLIEYLSKFDIISEVYKLIQADTRRIFTKHNLPNKLKTSLVALMRRVEKAVEKDMNFFTSMKKLYFLLCGMLGEYDNKWKVPSVRLTEKVRRELLRIDEIFSCGTFYGDLTFFVTKPLTKSKKKMINEVLQANKIKRGYVIRLIENQEAYCGNDVLIENQEACSGELDIEKKGFAIFFQTGNVLKASTLGCFVNIKRNEDEENTLHGVSCTHREPVIGRAVYMYLDQEKKYDVFGQECYGMYLPNTHDLVTVKIDNEKTVRCEVQMRDCENTYSNDWEVFFGDYHGKPVYKYGSRTGLTKGVVVGEVDTKRILEKKEHKDLSYSHNLLVSVQSALRDSNLSTVPVNNSTTSKDKFSDEGDCGSAVCWKSNEKVYVLGLLAGGFKDKESRMHITYCIKFGQAMQELQELFDITVSPGLR